MAKKATAAKAAPKGDSPLPKLNKAKADEAAAKAAAPSELANAIAAGERGAPEVDSTGVDRASEDYIVKNHPAHHHTREMRGIPHPK